MAEASTSGLPFRLSVTDVSFDNLPATCENCYLNFTEWVHVYYGNFAKTIEFSQNHGLILKECKCSSCGENSRLDLNKKAWRCDRSFAKSKKKRKRCSFKVSIFHDSWFDHSHVDAETNLRFCYLYLSDYFSYDLARTEIRGITNTTICDWASFIREVIVNWVVRRQKKIGGEGKIVEIDESKFGKRKYNVGKLVIGKWVFGGLCRETRDFFAIPVEKRNSPTLLQCIRDYIEPGTTIISDCWKAYDCLSEEGFTHLKVNHKLNFVDPKTKAHTNNIERKWRDLKSRVPRYGRREGFFIGYLAMAYFKFHFSDSTQHMHAFATLASRLYPLSRHS